MYSQIFLSNNYPTLFGIGGHIITDNTSPYFQKDDYIITVSSDEYNIGDTVVYTTLKDEILVDKIKSISDGKYYFENNVEEHSTIFESSLKGNVVLTIGHIGPCMQWIQGPYGTIVIFMAIIIIVETPHLVVILINKKR